MSPKQKREDVKTRLLGLWERTEQFGRPIGCVATTYTFDAGFFEEECLTRFAGIDSDPAEDLAAYIVEREEKLSEVTTCVLVDAGHVSPERSLRWNLLPVLVPGGGIQHAKVSLLVWERCIRVLVGSANLTVPGYRQNFENVGVVDFSPDGEVPIALLREVLGFIDGLRRFTPGGLGAAEIGPQLALTRFVELLRTTTADWTTGEWERYEPQVVFVPLVPGRTSLFTQIRDRVWSGTGPDVSWVMSPFFDQGDNARRTVESLVEIMGKKGERLVHFMGPGIRLPDGSTDLELPETLKVPWLPRVTHEFAMVVGRDDEGNSRGLHAKSLWLQRGDDEVYVIGSSNFTGPGTGIASAGANIEANLAYRIPAGSAFSGRCEESYPPYEEISLSDSVRFVQSPFDETQDTEAYVALPPGFGEALYQPDGPRGSLLLHIDATAPLAFVVRTHGGESMVDGKVWRSDGAGSPHVVQWLQPRPPSALDLEWGAEDGSWKHSWWIVNVTDASRLPPPDELKDLPLQLLLEILSSARPLHEALTYARRRGNVSGSKMRDLDPHQRVDTSQYLLKRVKRVSVALEGLRARLGRPAFSLDALRWRLEGPVGPLALARRLSEEEPRAAAFLIAEAALVVRRVDWGPIATVLGHETVASETEKCVAALKELAASHPTAPAVATYVAESFAATGA